MASIINNALTDVLRRGKGMDPALIDCPATITKIDVSGDLKVADCYFFPFNTKLSPKELEDAFERSKYSIRALVTDKIKLKYSPELRFRPPDKVLTGELALSGENKKSFR